jgi:hypothetical protein
VRHAEIHCILFIVYVSEKTISGYPVIKSIQQNTLQSFGTVFLRLYTCETNMKDGEKDGHQMHEEIHSIHPTENTKTIVKNKRLKVQEILYIVHLKFFICSHTYFAQIYLLWRLEIETVK